MNFVAENYAVLSKIVVTRRLNIMPVQFLMCATKSEQLCSGGGFLFLFFLLSFIKKKQCVCMRSRPIASITISPLKQTYMKI